MRRQLHILLLFMYALAPFTDGTQFKMFALGATTIVWILAQ